MWLLVEFVDDENKTPLALPLPEGTMTVGRGDECDFVIRDKKISRTHLEITRTKNKVTFLDLGSTSGTHQSGKKVLSGTLQANKVEIGNISLLAVKRFHPLEAKHDGSSSKKAANKEIFFDWQPFSAFLDRLRGFSEPKILLESLLLGLADLLAADRGFVLLSAAKKEKRFIPIASHSLDNTEEFIALSRTVIRRTTSAREVIFINDTVLDDWYKANCQQTFIDSSRSILCAPLVTSDKVIGVVYVDGDADNFAFGEAHIPLLNTFTGLASELLAAAQTRKNLVQAKQHIEALNKLSSPKTKLFLGKSPLSKQLDNNISRAAKQDVTVLITGETGTGKEMVARRLHQLSHRCNGPFIAVNCASLPRESIEVELFGAEKGAYTGSLHLRLGRFELASGGTLFLDEVGDIPLEYQVKLLRVLEERALFRLGAGEAIPLDFKLLCATNANLEKAVDEGTFRRDFFYRINVFRLHLPPLRERKDDIIPLSEFILQQLIEERGITQKVLTGETKKLLLQHKWPGNVRELKNLLERATVIEKDEIISPGSLGWDETYQEEKNDDGRDEFWDNLPFDYDKALEEFERTLLKRSLVRNEGNITAVAREYGKTRPAIYRRLRKLGIDF